MVRILKILNNFLPFSYELFKENYDKIYNQLTENIKFSWLSSQHSSLNGFIPFSAFMITFICTIFLNFFDFPKYSNIILSFLMFLFFYVIALVGLNIFHWDKYVDEKFLELSKEK